MNIKDQFFKIQKIFKNKYKIYLVGGCVRDLFMNNIPKDYDFTTSATPDEIEKLVADYNDSSIYTIPTGKKYGTITIMVDNIPFETTTFRKDVFNKFNGEHRPSDVIFSKNIEDDLCRRDFTINAMAINLDAYINYLNNDINLIDNLIDPFNGLNDIKSKSIRCVTSKIDKVSKGEIFEDPGSRFKEDGLRILRAIRFALKYKFKIEKETMEAIWENHNCLNNISKERIQSELNQMLLNWTVVSFNNEFSDEFVYYYGLITFVLKKIIPELLELVSVTHNSMYHMFDVFTHSVLVMNKISTESDNLGLKLAALFHDVGKLEAQIFDEKKLTYHFYGHPKISVSKTKIILEELKYSNDIKNEVLTLIEYHDAEMVTTKAAVKRWLNKLGKEMYVKLLQLQLADKLTHVGMGTELKIKLKYHTLLNLINEIESDAEVFQLKDLAIDGNDLIEIGFIPGKVIGFVLNKCLEQVINEHVENTKDALINFALSVPI